jgi:hypothetical protein
VLEVFIASLYIFLLELLICVLLDHYLLCVALGLVACDCLLVALPPDSEASVEAASYDEVS